MLNSKLTPPLKLSHPVKQIQITTAQLQSIVGDKIDKKGVVIRRSQYAGHWLRGLSSGSGYRWKVTQREILYGPDAPKPGERQFYSDHSYRMKVNGRELWRDLVNAADIEWRSSEEN